MVKQHEYVITNDTVLLDELDSHGFWVMGKSSVPTRNQLLPDDLVYAGGIRLTRTFGMFESAVCFADNQSTVQTLVDNGFRYIGPDGFISAFSISAQGTGNYATNFTWSNGAAVTDGEKNAGQTFTPPPFNNPVIIVISAHGETEPPIGSSWFFSGTVITGAVLNSPVTLSGQTQYVTEGWAGTGSLPSFGGGTNTLPFTLTNDSTLSWSWWTNFYLDVSTAGGGNVNQSSAFLSIDSNVTVLATPSGPATFDGWSGTGVPPGSETNNPLVLTMDQARMILATFGSTVPSLGSNDVRIIRIDIDSNVWISASGTNGWIPTPFISTNIIDTNNWTAVTNYQYVYSNGLWDVWFPFDQELTPSFFFLNVTN